MKWIIVFYDMLVLKYSYMCWPAHGLGIQHIFKLAISAWYSAQHFINPPKIAVEKTPAENAGLGSEKKTLGNTSAGYSALNFAMWQ